MRLRRYAARAGAIGFALFAALIPVPGVAAQADACGTGDSVSITFACAQSLVDEGLSTVHQVVIDGCSAQCGTVPDVQPFIDAALTATDSCVEASGDLPTCRQVVDVVSNEVNALRDIAVACVNGAEDPCATLIATATGLTRDVTRAVNDCTSGANPTCAGLVAAAESTIAVVVAAADDCAAGSGICGEVEQFLLDLANGLSDDVTECVSGSSPTCTATEQAVVDAVSAATSEVQDCLALSGDDLGCKSTIDVAAVIIDDQLGCTTSCTGTGALCQGDQDCLNEMPIDGEVAGQAADDLRPPPSLVPVSSTSVPGAVGTESLDASDPAAGYLTEGPAAPGTPDLTAQASPASYPPNYIARNNVTGKPYPQSAAVFLDITEHDGSEAECSGALIGPHTVLTAGHCVYLSQAGGWIQSAVVIPGFDNKGFPYGTCNAFTFQTVRGWTAHADSEYDYGAMEISNCSGGNSRDVGNRAGYFGFHDSSNEQIVGLTQEVLGYPSGSPLNYPEGTQWLGKGGHIVQNWTQHQFEVNYQTAQGDSGGPSFAYTRSGPYVWGAMTALYSQTDLRNMTRRITDGEMNNLENWRR